MIIKKIFRKAFRKIKYRFWYSDFDRNLLNSKQNQSGEITLFGNPFYYHYGMAFFDTYKEVFNSEIYKFSTINKEPVIIDCGANMGLSLLFFSKNYPNSKITAFEPDSSVIPYLKKNITSQNLNNIELHSKAVWIENTDLEFFTDNGLGGRVIKEYENQIPEIVKAIRLKDFLKKYDVIDMLKIDIEGAEYEVIKDCENSLKNVKNIFIEYHSMVGQEQHLDGLLSILKNVGYRYHLKESFSRKRPFIDKKIVCEHFDMAINIFAYK